MSAHSMRGAHGVSTTPHTSMTPAASPSWRRCEDSAVATSWTPGSPPSRTLSTGAPWVPRPRPATARASSPRSPTPSFAASPAFELPASGTLRHRHCLPDARQRGDAGRGYRTRRRRRGRHSPWLARRPGRTRDPLGPRHAPRCPTFRQVFMSHEGLSGIDLDRKVYRVRKRAENDGKVVLRLAVRAHAHLQGNADHLPARAGFPDLMEPDYETELALVHSRFSTNTFPSWPLAQPLRGIAHNGEINTVRGNRNWMAAREGTLASDLLGDIESILPVCTPSASDTASFDEVLELLHLGGRSMPHAVLMMIPEAWQNNPEMDPARRAFYEYHSALMEPWDGPAALHFSDGTVVGAVLDRNGLRPGRFWVTDDGLVVVRFRGRAARHRPRQGGPQGAPPAGPHAPGRHRRGPHHRGRARSRLRSPPNTRTASGSPTTPCAWPTFRSASTSRTRHSSVVRRQRDVWVHRGGVRVILTPMAQTGVEPIGAMGSDTPIAVLSDASAPALRLFHADVRAGDQPAARRDPRGDRHVGRAARSARSRTCSSATPEHARKLILDFPVIDNDELAKIIHVDADPKLAGSSRSLRIAGLYSVQRGRRRARSASQGDLRRGRPAPSSDGVSFIVLSDRDSDARTRAHPVAAAARAPFTTTWCATTRAPRSSLVVEAGDVREVHHVALLIGYGAAAVNPYLAMETVEELAKTRLPRRPVRERRPSRTSSRRSARAC